jgi:hypothetical protein
MALRVGAYPGSFNPPTHAHISIAAAARAQHGLQRVDLVVSRVALAKESVARPLLAHRIDVLNSVVESQPGLGLVVTDSQLLVDIAGGYDVLIMGADKWVQIQDPVFYDGSETSRDAAMAALPDLAIVPRRPHAHPRHLELDLPEDLHHVSSTAARTGQHHLMVEAARRFDQRTGAWTDPQRYERWLARSR